MPTKNPRINVSLETPLYELIRDVAERSGVSMSMAARDLLREALALQEDAALSVLAEDRASTFARKIALTHEDVSG